MLAIYFGALIIGGVLVALSVFAGGDGEAEFAGEAADEVSNLSVDHSAHGDGGELGWDGWLPVTSFRFWTFFLCFGGLTGSILTLLTNTVWPVTAGLSAAIGFASGITITRTLRHLRKAEVSDHIKEREFIGKTGQVLLPVSKIALGRIRVHARGRDIDLTAKTEDDTDFTAGEEVLVYEMDDGTALVSQIKKLSQ